MLISDQPSQLLWLAALTLVALSGPLLTYVLMSLRLRRASAQSSQNETKSAPREPKEAESPSYSERPSGGIISDFEATIFEGRRGSPGPRKQRFAVGSLRGQGHLALGQPRQDSVAAFELGNWVVFVLSDGVSNSKSSELGSQWLCENTEEVLRSVFGTQLTHDSQRWSQVNRLLTEGLLKLHVRRIKRLGLVPEPDITKLRLEAGSLYASTLELLAVERSSNESSNLGYQFVRLAGDGTLFIIDLDLGAIRFPVTNNPGEHWLSNREVGALPTYDAPPLVITGTLKPGEVIGLTTDGLGENLNTCPELIGRIKAFSNSPHSGYLELFDILQCKCDSNLDDRSIALAIQ